MATAPTLPADRRIDRSKIEGYLLHSLASRGKSAFFEACGFTPARWEELRDALLRHAASGQVSEAVPSPWGTRYIVRGSLFTPDRRQPPRRVCSVWQMDHGDTGVRLITAYPD